MGVVVEFRDRERQREWLLDVIAHLEYLVATVPDLDAKISFQCQLEKYRVQLEKLGDSPTHSSKP